MRALSNEEIEAWKLANPDWEEFSAKSSKMISERFRKMRYFDEPKETPVIVNTDYKPWTLEDYEAAASPDAYNPMSVLETYFRNNPGPPSEVVSKLPERMRLCGGNFRYQLEQMTPEDREAAIAENERMWAEEQPTKVSKQYQSMAIEEDYFICLPADGVYRPEDWPPEINAWRERELSTRGKPPESETES